MNRRPRGGVLTIILALEVLKACVADARSFRRRG